MKETVSLLVCSEKDAHIQVLLLPDGTKTFFPNLVEPWADGQHTRFSLEKGRYLVCLKKSGCYSLERCVDLEQDTSILLPALPRIGRGFEPREDGRVFFHEKAAWDKMAPDEDARWEQYRVIYDTPYFRKAQRENSAHCITTQNELLAFLLEHEKKNPNLSLFFLGKTGIYDLEIPLAVFSKDLPPNISSIEEAGEMLQQGSKPVVFYQAQIHGNEPASGEAALGMISYLSTPEGEALLDQIHVVIMPRMNPEGALLFNRRGGQGLDLNRDYLAAKGRETQASIRVFHAFLPCVVLDGHEAAGRKGIKSRIERNEDIQLSGGCAPNADPAFIDGNVALLDRSLEELNRMGLRTFFFRDHISGAGMATAIRYFAELGAPTVLIESRGIDLGTERFHRRVMGQFTVARACLEAVAENPAYYLQLSRKEMAHFADPYDREFVLEGAYTDDPEIVPAYPIEFLDTETGEVKKREQKRVAVFRVPVRTRPRPQSYLIPLGEVGDEALVSLLEKHYIQYQRREKGTALWLRAFEKEGDSYRLSALKEVSFPEGALEIPVAQRTSHIVSFLFEPDSVDPVEAKKNIALDALFFPETNCCIYRREREEGN